MPSISGELAVHLGSGKKPKSVPYTLDVPEHTAVASTAVCFMHGASGTHTSGNLPALAAAVAEAGLPCLRFTCRGGQLQHRIDVCKGVLQQACGLHGLAGIRQWVLSGHSMGARVACAVASEEQQAAAACMLFSYPLHPPGKPEQLRDALLIQLQLPVLLVRGSRDPFSRQDLWDTTLAAMQSTSWHQHSVESGDHSLHVSGSGSGGGGGSGSEAALQAVCAAVQQFLKDVVAGKAGGNQGASAAGGTREAAEPSAAKPPAAKPQTAQHAKQRTQGGKRQPGQQDQQRSTARGKRQGAQGKQPAKNAKRPKRSD